MDVLTDVLNALELKGWLSSRTEMTAHWRFEFEAGPDLIFHVLSRGGGLLKVAWEPEPIQLFDGDLMLFPHGDAHTIADSLTSPLSQQVCLTYDEFQHHQLFPTEEQGEKMLMLCGAFRFANPGDFPLRNALPRLILLRGEQGRLSPSFSDIVNLIARESSSSHIGGTEVFLRRLTEILFIQVIRLWLNKDDAAGKSWLAALRDQSVSTALGLIHQAPEYNWKVEELADRVALSRSAFTARFTSLVGEPPMKYLTRWRMLKATHMLRHNVRVEAIANTLGYESEVAFRKAFKRELGVPPAKYRQSVAL